MNKKLLFLLVLLLTAATGAWADEDLSNKIWQPGDKFNIGEAWFYFDDTDNGEYYQANGNEFTVPQLNSWSYYSNYKQWATLNFINYKKKVKNGTETTTSSSQKLWLTAPEDKRSADFPPVGFKIVSGAGTKESPYKFGLVYELPLEPYSVTMKDGTEDAENWSVPAEAAEGDKVTATYSGEKKVKSVKAVKKAAAPAYPLLSAATTSDIGKVVCAAGHLHDAKTAVPSGCTAVGILGKVTETGHGLILALKDATAQEWNTINDWTSVTTYAGTTLKVLPDDAARGTNLTSYTTLGETAVSNWAVAQKSDYEAIFQNLGSTTNVGGGYTCDGNVNAYITTGVGGVAIIYGCWSATEYDNGEAWYFYSEYWSQEGKDESNHVRPVLAF